MFDISWFGLLHKFLPYSVLSFSKQAAVPVTATQPGHGQLPPSLGGSTSWSCHPSLLTRRYYYFPDYEEIVDHERD